MNFHDKRVHTAFLILTSFLILISYRIISNIIAQNAETERIGQGQVAVAATSPIWIWIIGCRCKLIDSSDIMRRVFHEMRNAIKCTNTLCRLRNKIALISALQQSKAFSTVIHTSFPVKIGGKRNPLHKKVVCTPHLSKTIINRTAFDKT